MLEVGCGNGAIAERLRASNHEVVAVDVTMPSALATRDRAHCEVLLAGLLHGVTPLDALTFAGASAGVAGLAILAAWVPARQAERVAPVEILAAE